ncbi:MAG TPA: ATP-binding protein [Solirubrobacterales bacterium]|jgi:predicted AAA+ superfamily ATPase|nr:ATP-binding protein [Solirubrobacterales bacterium]
MPKIFPRANQSLVAEALADTRVVLLMGARQVGKSTLAEQIVRTDHPARMINLDEQPQREAALADPEGFIAGLERPVLIDEVQRGGPDLFLAIKSVVDADRSPGQFLLTGSANVLRTRKVWEALTGRVELINLGPLTQAEIEGLSLNFVDAVFAGRPPQVEGAPKGRDALLGRLIAGGYPEARLRSPKRRARWFDSYIQTTLGRDLKDISQARKLNEMPRLLRLIASQTANLFSASNLSQRLSIHSQTVDSHVSLLEAIFLVQRLPAWTPGIGSREIHHPKIYVSDTGLLLHLLGANEKRLREDDQITGKALENFVAMELVRHADSSEENPKAHHYRRGRDEIDVILENRAGDICAIEVKASATIRDKDWGALARLRDARPKSFRCGVLFYTGAQTLPLGDRLFAVPLSGLWAQ